jgi:hypothetical protein
MGQHMKSGLNFATCGGVCCSRWFQPFASWRREASMFPICTREEMGSITREEGPSPLALPNTTRSMLMKRRSMIGSRMDTLLLKTQAARQRTYWK